MCGTFSTGWPKDLFDFYIPEVDDQLRELADIAEDEDWNYHNTPSDLPSLSRSCTSLWFTFPQYCSPFMFPRCRLAMYPSLEKRCSNLL